MFKRCAVMVLSLFIFNAGAFAMDAIFSNTEEQQFNLQPLNYSYKPVVAATEISPVSTVSTKSTNSDLQSKNFQNAINNLDTAQVDIREQLANYSSLMAQSKANYESKRSEYRSYKKQYNALKRKMRSVEKSKKLIQGNIYVKNSVQN